MADFILHRSRDNQSSSKQTKIRNSNQSSYQKNRSSKEINNIEIINHRLSKKNNAWSARIGIVSDHHTYSKKNQKKKCSQRCIISLIIFTAVLIGLIIATILIALPYKSNTTSSSNKTALLRWNSTGITIAGVSGIRNNTPDHLYRPWDIALDWSNTLYVTDRLNNRIQKFFKDNSNGTTVPTQVNRTLNLTASDLDQPTGISIDSSSNLYVNYLGDHRAVFWSNDGLSDMIITGTGTPGTVTNQLSSPYGITRDSSSGTIYIADFVNHRVISFKLGTLSGSVVAGGNGQGTNKTQLSLPIAVYFDSLSNSLLIANYGANNIVRWILGVNQWTLIVGNIYESNGTSSTELYNPTDVMLDPMGNMYAADRYNHRVQFFLADQSSGVTIAGVTGMIGTNSTLFNEPISLALDNQLNLYVADHWNHRIQKFIRY